MSDRVSDEHGSLVLRLSAPIQSWGIHSEFNTRQTNVEPTKSGIIGLLAAAQGRRRADPIEDLVGLFLAVRTDRPGTRLRDYHTASDYRGRPLPSAQVTAKGVQKPTSPAKHTYVTHRYYLQDATFVAAIGGSYPLLKTLAAALRRPAFPLALGRRCCPPTQPIILLAPAGEAIAPDCDRAIWSGSPPSVLQWVPWQAPQSARDEMLRSARWSKQAPPATIDLPITADLSEHSGRDERERGYELRADVPTSFDPRTRGFTSRRVQQLWAHDIPTGLVDPDTANQSTTAVHDPFSLLGW